MTKSYSDKVRQEVERITDGDAAGDTTKGRPTNAEVLAGIAFAETDLWHDGTSVAFASVGRRTLPVRSKLFRQWITNRYRVLHDGKVPGGEALTSGVNAIEAKAVFDGPRRTAHVRVAGHAGKVYVHLADDDDTVVEIGPDGWRECTDPPVRFRKSNTALPLPIPTRGNSLAPLKDLLGIGCDDQFSLVVSWLCGCLLPEGPFPTLLLFGAKGSAKTTAARALLSLIDPTAAPTRSEPKEVRDLMVATRSAWVLAFDNLSHLPSWLSDALCVLATGGGFATRELYSDDGEIVFNAKRPVILTSIEDVATRGDLIDRGILVRRQPIPEEARKTEAEFWAELEKIKPVILGALFSRVAVGLKELPRVKLGRLPRMADFARWAVACERGAGEPERFLTAYTTNQAEAQVLPLEDSPLTGPILKLLEPSGEWEGTPTDLLAALATHATDPKGKDWPKRANSLTGKLRRLQPNLLTVYKVQIDLDQKAGDGNSRRITVRRAPPAIEVRKSSSGSSGPSGPAEMPENRLIPPDGPGGARSSGSQQGSSHAPSTGRSFPPPDGPSAVRSSGEIPSVSRLSDSPDDPDDVSRTSIGKLPSEPWEDSDVMFQLTTTAGWKWPQALDWLKVPRETLFHDVPVAHRRQLHEHLTRLTTTPKEVRR